MNAGGPPRLVATGSQTVGPFFHFALTTNAALGTMAPGDGAGERIRLKVQVQDGDGAPVPDAMIELYHADDSGAYRQPRVTGFGRLPTADDGTCVFETMRPGSVPASGEAPHVNVCVFARGLLRHLYTRIYFAGDAGLERDPLMSHVPAERRHTLLATPAAEETATWQFVVRLQGDDETVFFDL